MMTRREGFARGSTVSSAPEAAAGWGRALEKGRHADSRRRRPRPEQHRCCSSTRPPGHALALAQFDGRVSALPPIPCRRAWPRPPANVMAGSPPSPWRPGQPPPLPHVHGVDTVVERLMSTPNTAGAGELQQFERAGLPHAVVDLVAGALLNCVLHTGTANRKQSGVEHRRLEGLSAATFCCPMQLPRFPQRSAGRARSSSPHRSSPLVRTILAAPQARAIV